MNLSCFRAVNQPLKLEFAQSVICRLVAAWDLLNICERLATTFAKITSTRMTQMIKRFSIVIGDRWRCYLVVCCWCVSTVFVALIILITFLLLVYHTMLFVCCLPHEVSDFNNSRAVLPVISLFYVNVHLHWTPLRPHWNDHQLLFVEFPAHQLWV